MKKSINFDRGKLFYSDYGSGDTIILLHGYLESSAVWNDFAMDLGRHFRILVIDLPGHGESWVYGKSHSMEFMAEGLKEIMNREELNKVFMVGHSMGGYVALAFLELYPDRLNSYCLFHSHPFADTDEAISNRKREIKVVESGKKDLIYPVNVPRMFADINIEKFSDSIEKHKKIASLISGEGIIAVLNGMINRPSRVELLERGDLPLLLIAGRYDNYIPVDDLVSHIELPYNSELVILENSGHLGFIEEKERSKEIIISFYNKILNRTKYQ